MRRLSRLFKRLERRLVEMQIAMIEDYRSTLEDQLQINDTWLASCRDREFRLALELENITVLDRPHGHYIIEHEDGRIEVINAKPIDHDKAMALIKERLNAICARS